MGKCFVPGCRTGYASNKTAKRVSLFQPPRDESLLGKWMRKIPRFDRVLGAKDLVCELHFEHVNEPFLRCDKLKIICVTEWVTADYLILLGKNKCQVFGHAWKALWTTLLYRTTIGEFNLFKEHFIERSFVHKIKGEVIEIPRGKPRLKLDALPTIFPNAPSYFTTRIKPRKPPKERKEETPKQADITNNNINDACLDLLEDHASSSADDFATLWNWIVQFDTEHRWLKTLSADESQVCFSLIAFNNDCSEITPSAVRQVIFYRDGSKPILYVRGFQVDSSQIFKEFRYSRASILLLLSKLTKAKECVGIDLSEIVKTYDVNTITVHTFTTSNVIEGILYSRKCCRLFSGICKQCKVVRKVILKRAKYRYNKKRQENNVMLCFTDGPTKEFDFQT